MGIGLILCQRANFKMMYTLQTLAKNKKVNRMEESHKQMIQFFMACTGAAREDAIKYLEATDYDFDFSVVDYEYDKLSSIDGGYVAGGQN